MLIVGRKPSGSCCLERVQVGSPCDLGFLEYGGWVPRESIPKTSSSKRPQWKTKVSNALTLADRDSLPLHSLGQGNHSKLEFEERQSRGQLSVRGVAENLGFSLIYCNRYYEPHLAVFTQN